MRLPPFALLPRRNSYFRSICVDIVIIFVVVAEIVLVVVVAAVRTWYIVVVIVVVVVISPSPCCLFFFVSPGMFRFRNIFLFVFFFLSSMFSRPTVPDT